jgi:hypothetical protein
MSRSARSATTNSTSTSGRSTPQTTGVRAAQGVAGAQSRVRRGGCRGGSFFTSAVRWPRVVKRDRFVRLARPTKPYRQMLLNRVDTPTHCPPPGARPPHRSGARRPAPVSDRYRRPCSTIVRGRLHQRCHTRILNTVRYDPAPSRCLKTGVWSARTVCLHWKHLPVAYGGATCHCIRRSVSNYRLQSIQRWDPSTNRASHSPRCGARP